MLVLGLIVASCGKSGKGIVSHVNTQNQDSTVYGAHEPGDKVAMSVAGPLGGEFTFEPLDGDGTPDEKGENAYQLKLEPGDGEGGSGSGGGDFGLKPTIELTITAKKDMGNSWKYALGTIEYDPEKYNPVEFIPGDLFGNDEKDVLNATLFQEKGRIAFWCGLKNFDKKDAKPGGEIGTFVIELVPWEPPKGASAAPDDEDDAVFWFNQFDSENLTRIVYWSEVNRGDGNVNGEVYISDLTLLAQYNGQYVSSNPLLDVVDYDDNGVIDCTPDPDPQVRDDYKVWYESASNIENIAGYKVVLDRVGVGEDRIFCIPGPEIAGQTRSNILAQQTADNPDNYTDETPTRFFKSENGAVGYWWNFTDYETQDINGVIICEGVYNVTVRPFDSGFDLNDPECEENDEHLGTPACSFAIDVEGPPVSTAPVASLSVSPAISEELFNYARSSDSDHTFNVTFDASGSTDVDDDIAHYIWTFDSTHVNILGDSEEVFPYLFANYNPGGGQPHTIEIEASVKVMDETGLYDTAYAYITLNRNFPPYAYLEPVYSVGNAPLEVEFDASESFDPNTYDDEIESFEWDWEGDGVFETNTGDDPTTDHTYYSTGYFMPTVKVTDTRGASGYQIAEVRANPTPALLDRFYLDSAVPSIVQSGDPIEIDYSIEQLSRPLYNFSNALHIFVRDVNETGVVGTFNNVFDFSSTGFLTHIYPRSEGGENMTTVGRGSGLTEVLLTTTYQTPIYHPVPPGTTSRVGTLTINTKEGYSGLVEVRIPADPASGYTWHTFPLTQRKDFDNPDYTPLVFDVIP